MNQIELQLSLSLQSTGEYNQTTPQYGRTESPYQTQDHLVTETVGWFSNRTGTSVDDGARKSNNWLDQWQSGKFSTASRVSSFTRDFPLSTDVSVLLLKQISIKVVNGSTEFFLKGMNGMNALLHNEFR